MNSKVNGKLSCASKYLDAIAEPSSDLFWRKSHSWLLFVVRFYQFEEARCAAATNMCSIADCSKKGVKTIGWNKQYVGQMIVQNWPSRWFKWFKNVSRVCASWRERACPDRTSSQSSLEPHSSARSCWSPAKKSFATLKPELKEEKQFWVCSFYLVLLLVQEERVAPLESLELFLFRKVFICWPRSPFSALTYWRKLSIMAWFFPNIHAYNSQYSDIINLGDKFPTLSS